MKLVEETCVHIIKTHKTFKTNLIEQVNNFINDPLQRTIDVIQDLRVLLVQLYCFNKLPDEDKKIISEDPQTLGEEMTILADQMDVFTRFWVEEAHRRQNSNNLSQYMATLLVPGHRSFVSDLKAKFKEQ